MPNSIANKLYKPKRQMINHQGRQEKQDNWSHQSVIFKLPEFWRDISESSIYHAGPIAKQIASWYKKSLLAAAAPDHLSSKNETSCDVEKKILLLTVLVEQKYQHFSIQLLNKSNINKT
jgi:hypothetical protein